MGSGVLGHKMFALRISVSGLGWMWADALGLKALQTELPALVQGFSEQARVQLGRLGVFIRSARVGCQKLVIFGTKPLHMSALAKPFESFPKPWSLHPTASEPWIEALIVP